MFTTNDNGTVLYWPSRIPLLFVFYVSALGCALSPSFFFVDSFVHGVICGAIWQERGIGYWIRLQGSVVLT